MNIFTVLIVKFDSPCGVPECNLAPKTFSTSQKAVRYVLQTYKNAQIRDREYDEGILYEFTEESNMYYITICETVLDE